MRFGSVPIRNWYPILIYNRVQFPATARQFRLAIPVPKAEHIILDKLICAYPTTGPDPSTFLDPTYTIVDNSRSRKFSEELIPLRLTSTPGRFAPAGVTQPAKNQQYLNAKTINWIFYQNSTIQINFGNYIGTGGPAFVDILLKGRGVLRNGILK